MKKEWSPWKLAANSLSWIESRHIAGPNKGVFQEQETYTLYPFRAVMRDYYVLEYYDNVKTKATYSMDSGICALPSQTEILSLDQLNE